MIVPFRGAFTAGRLEGRADRRIAFDRKGIGAVRKFRIRIGTDRKAVDFIARVRLDRDSDLRMLLILPLFVGGGRERHGALRCFVIRRDGVHFRTAAGDCEERRADKEHRAECRNKQSSDFVHSLSPFDFVSNIRKKECFIHFLMRFMHSLLFLCKYGYYIIHNDTISFPFCQVDSREFP